MGNLQPHHLIIQWRYISVDTLKPEKFNSRHLRLLLELLMPIPMIFFVNKTLSCSLYHGKKKTHKTSGYSDNSERNINFKFDRLRAVNCTIWSEWNFIHQKRTAEKTRARNWNRPLQLSLFLPKINVFMPIYGTRPWIQRKANIADVLVTELTGQNSYLGCLKLICCQMTSWTLIGVV